ncbi:D(2) dopamine receptor [Biomphalaria pfeifferi]|uniref:D(2) dopamine receptor n=1 Tax=Biomphalaria pfeifferi TaxID=112525 RepID=A0AAD8AX36_BIOPF|nr:D(2) dopamine receptor [Biomphalaria pfeifferi]
MMSWTFNSTQVQDDMKDVNETDGPFDLSMTVVLFVMSILIVTSNSVTLLAVCKNKGLKSLPNRFITALAAADLLVGVGILAMLVQKYARPSTRWIECQYSLAIMYSSLNFSLFILLSVALDRYLYIVHPFIYRRHVCPRLIKVSITMEWLLASVHGFIAAYLPVRGEVETCNPLFAFQLKFVQFVFPAIFSLVCSGIFVLYVLIAKTAKMHWDRRVQRMLDIHNTMLKSRSSGLKTIADRLDEDCSHLVARNLDLNKINLRENVDVTSSSGVAEKSNHFVALANNNIIGNSEVKHVLDLNLEQEVKEQEVTTAENKLKEETVTREILFSDVNIEQTAVTLQSEVKAVRERHQQVNDSSVSVRSLRWLKLTAIVSGLFTICWTPIMVDILVSWIYPLPRKVTNVFSLLGIANSAINFFVYAIHTKQFRQVIVQRLLCR